MKPIAVIVNAGGGSFVAGETDRAVTNAFAGDGLEIDLHLAESGDDIVRFAESSAAGNAEIIVAGGGDGTLNAVAARIAAAGKVFGVLPLGTLNHFSKDLGIPQDLASAVGVIKTGHTRQIDLGDVNGRIFLNNSSIGLYPRIVHKREQQQERLGRGKWSAAFWAAVATFRRDPFISVRFEVNGRKFKRKTPFVFVGNNEYGMDLYNVGSRESLDKGELSVYFLKRGGRWGVVMLVVRTFVGLLKNARDFETINTDEITIDVRKNRIMVAIDGEVEVMETPLTYRILPKALTVIVPVTEESK